MPNGSSQTFLQDFVKELPGRRAVTEKGRGRGAGLVAEDSRLS
jgi:hypothetical protein